VNLEPGQEYLWHGVTWATGAPTLLLADTNGGVLDQMAVMGLELGLKTTGPTRFCTGRYGFVDTFHVEALPCPGQAEASSGQCASCLEQDEFRFAHQFHTGGRAPQALTAYMAQPHWLYIATFGHAATKVGTAAEARRKSRLDEQGPRYATYLTQSPDGRAVRRLEDALTRELGLAQTVHRTAKVAALAEPDPGRAHAEHERVVASATTALAALGVTASRQEWSPPPEGLALRSPDQRRGRAVYPHDLRAGEHGFRIESCSGTQVLARVSADAEDVRYVVDLNTLKGRRVVFGDYTSPATTFQESLF
jgi:hypothetical protein